MSQDECSRDTQGRPRRHRRRRERVAWVLVPLIVALCLAAFAAVSASTVRARVLTDTRSVATAKPLATVTLRAAATSVHTGRAVRLQGSVPRNHVRTTVAIQAANAPSGAWRAWRTVSISSASTYASTWLAPPATGTYYFRTVYGADRRYAASASPTVSVTVRPEPDLLARRDLIYGSEIETAQVDGRPAVDPKTRIPARSSPPASRWCASWSTTCSPT